MKMFSMTVMLFSMFALTSCANYGQGHHKNCTHSCEKGECKKDKSCCENACGKCTGEKGSCGDSCHLPKKEKA